MAIRVDWNKITPIINEAVGILPRETGNKLWLWFNQQYPSKADIRTDRMREWISEGINVMLLVHDSFKDKAAELITKINSSSPEVGRDYLQELNKLQSLHDKVIGCSSAIKTWFQGMLRLLHYAYPGNTRYRQGAEYFGLICNQPL